MSAIDGISGSGGVRPLRSTAKARDGQAEVVGRFSVEDLKNGGSLELGGLTSSDQGEGGATIRQRYRGKGPAPSARRAQNQKLTEEERIEKLSQVRKSAIEYEAFFVDHLVKQMRQSPFSQTPGGDTFSEIAEQPFRDFLSQAGGLGLADVITGQIARQEGLDQTLAENPEIMGPNWKAKIPPNLMPKDNGGLSLAPTDPAMRRK